MPHQPPEKFVPPEKKFIPLMVGDRLAGRVHIDLVNNTIEGTLDPELSDILWQGLGNNLWSISFFGKPVEGEVIRAQERFHQYSQRQPDTAGEQSDGD